MTTDAEVRDLARRAGLSVQWTDYANKRHRVPLDAIRRILAALGLPCATNEELAESRRTLEGQALPSLITATVGRPVSLPLHGADPPPRVRLVREDGTADDLAVGRDRTAMRLPAIETAGYHTLEIGARRIGLGIAPARCLTVSDMAPGERLWGIAAQTYGLRSAGDCGIGDMAGVRALATALAPLRGEALALSPAHALFIADPSHFSPYSPSSRLFLNPLLAEPASLFGAARVGAARTAAGVGTVERELEAAALIDWPSASRAKMAVLRCLFEDFLATDLAAAPQSSLAQEFAGFCKAQGRPLQLHALFETLHAARLHADRQAWDWRNWPAEWREPGSAAVARFAEQHQREIQFHCFLQWIADRSIGAAQQHTRHLGMRIGLIADLAVGMNGAGSHVWSSQNDILGGVEIGAPPDLFNAKGQNWGLTTFSPRGLRERGFAGFLATLRACMRNAGGVRIDHAMGLMRLWVVPAGAEPRDGAYLNYPLDDLLRLTALESHRHRAIVIGEDLGTVPAGFRDRLAGAGIYGMRVLWFEREDDCFIPPPKWPSDAVAMTSTHDLPTVAGWWRGADIKTRSELGLVNDAPAECATRSKEREGLWRALQAADAAKGVLPSPDDTPRVADAAVKFLAETPCRLTLLPLEDALGTEEQPNLPTTIDQHPNWRRRYQGEAGGLLDDPRVRDRLAPLTKRAKP